MKFGSIIKQLRKKRGINQQLLADQIGVTQTYLSLLESNQKIPSLNLIKSLSKELGIPASILAYLILNKDDISSNKQGTFEKLNPLIEDLINQLLLNEENPET